MIMMIIVGRDDPLALRPQVGQICQQPVIRMVIDECGAYWWNGDWQGKSEVQY
jgi:hypothetical protein